MQNESNARQQITQRIKDATNILVTVGKNPSVDELSAALGLSLMLSRLDKHSTAVFSGATPEAISFLEPEKTFEDSVDSLRDFIIALDKEKADRLRYKVEDDVVRIFITPYKAILSEKDLQFSQGDFNVELIVALGVEKREDLDAAITAHGRILHDATVVTINSKKGESSLGSIDWTDESSSSLCEMLVSLSEALQSGLLDQQISTALLTGIVAATDRFRNEHTSPRVMTMAAQLMAAGANQQLIATKLEEGHELVSSAPATDGSTELSEGESTKITDETRQSTTDGSLEISHDASADAAPVVDASDEALQKAEAELADSLASSVPVPSDSPTVDEIQKDLEQATENLQNDSPESEETTEPDVTPVPELELAGDSAPEVDPELALIPPHPETPVIKKEHRDWRSDTTAATPTFGGTLNATTSEAEEEREKLEASTENHQILSHDSPAADAPAVTVEETPAPVVDEATDNVAPTEPDLQYEETKTPGSFPTLEQIDGRTRGKDTEDARAAVDAVLSTMPFDAAHNPVDSAGAVPAIEVHHDGTLSEVHRSDTPVETTPVSEVPASGPEQAPTPEPTPLAPSPYGVPTLPPLPDFSTLPPLPEEQPVVPDAPVGGTVPTAPAPELPALPQAPAPADPGQFRIPGQ